MKRNQSAPHNPVSGWFGLVVLLVFLAGCLPNGALRATHEAETLTPPIPAHTPGSNLANTTPLPTSSPTPQPTPTFEVRLAWFYKPPEEERQLEEVAKSFNFFIMTKGDEPERNRLLSLGAERPMLQYLRFEAIQDPGGCEKKPWNNNVAYLPGDFCRISSEHPDWFLLDSGGDRIVDKYQGVKFYLMDPGNPEWRAFFLDRIRQAHFDPNWDGVFLDNVEVSLLVRDKQDEIPEKYPDEASYQAAIQGFLKYLHTNYFEPQHKLLFANLVGRGNDETFLQSIAYLDGVMHEGWSVDWPKRWRAAEIWERQLAIAEETQAQGKFIILVAQGKEDDHEVQRFAYASYLLVANGRAAFRYANSDDYNAVWYYDNYALQLGKPLGPRYQSGDVWRRDYTNGYVWVNPEEHTAEVALNTQTSQTAP